ncbi:IclR family transcriptional regulator, partial [Streptomyces fulvissimus]|nr:IclR family transcriptional regulator [Streptomyces microflavus]
PSEGFAYSQGEYDPATAGLAVPVLVRSQPIGSLTLVGPHDQLDDRKNELLVPLRSAGESLGELLTPRQ